MLTVMAYIGWGMMWVAVSVAVIFAVYWTHTAMPLWAFVIPATIELRPAKQET